jgi:hypothetical protein
MMIRPAIGALLAALLATPAAAGQMICMPWGCVSLPWFAAPVYGPPGWRPGQFVPPPVVVTPRMIEAERLRAAPPPQQSYRPYVPPGYDESAAPAPPPQAQASPPSNYAPAPAPQPRRYTDPPPKAKFQRDPEQAEIEDDIKAFCEAHQDEALCIKLDHYLRKHGMKP